MPFGSNSAALAMLALSRSMRGQRLWFVARSIRELTARTVFWKFSALPSRSVPRLMLSSLDGTQACVASGEIAAAPR